MQYELVYARSKGSKTRIIGVQLGNEFIRKKGTETEEEFISRITATITSTKSNA